MHPFNIFIGCVGLEVWVLFRPMGYYRDANVRIVWVVRIFLDMGNNPMMERILYMLWKWIIELIVSLVGPDRYFDYRTDGRVVVTISPNNSSKNTPLR